MSNSGDKTPGSNVQIHTLGKTIRDPHMDAFCLIFYCQEHRKVLLRHYYEANAYWFCYIWAQTNISRTEIIGNALDKLQDCPFYISSVSDIHHLRIEVAPGKFILRKTLLVHIQAYLDKCCTDFSDLKWFQIQQLIDSNNFTENLYGFIIPLLKIVNQESAKYAEEQRFNRIEYYTTRTPEKDELWSASIFLQTNPISSENWSKIYQEIMQFTYPVFHMTPISFEIFMAQYMNQTRQDNFYRNLFNAFNESRTGYLTFIEFIIGLIQLEWSCPSSHRAKFVFRFYDNKKRGFLEEKEISILKKDSNVKFNAKAPLSETVFEVLYSNHEEFGSLVRSRNSLINSIAITAHYIKNDILHDGIRISRPFILDPIGVHISIRGFKSLQKIWPCSNLSVEKTENQTNCFSDLYVLLRLLKTFAKQNKDAGNKSFMSESVKFSNLLTVKLLKIFGLLRQKLLLEGSLVKVQSPCFVHGDIVGNLNDLIALVDMLMPNFPFINSRHVFLGNYFGTKPWGLECFIFLTCLKLIIPDKIYLILGYNELNVRTIEKLCLQKYGSENGHSIFQMLKKTIVSLPVAVVVDSSVYCCNTNIIGDNIEEINKTTIINEDLTKTSYGQRMFSLEPLSDDKIQQFLNENNLSHLIRSNTNLRLEKTLKDRHVRVTLVSHSINSPYQLVTVQIVQKFLRVLAKKNAKSNQIARKMISPLDTTIN